MAINEALLIIDYTNDFVDEKGALTCGEPGQLIEPAIIHYANEALKDDSWVLLPTDVHVPNDPYHPETKLFPPHNVRGTWGRKYYGELEGWYNEQESNPHVWAFDKTRYSSFAGTDLDIRLRERHIDTLHLVGVCTDICVLHTAVDAYNLGYNLVIHKNGVATFTEHGQEWALDHFKNSLGAKIVTN
ncbi:cysteine hydrolase family protein [Pediococcus claussenii]|uniref:Isochorismatase family protein n=1 Tax=Pediococcus claussenii (strain ATCC BAA-344 / DSM 14800 / JCM 18046 / KCTC 3811 / LMG 21948 / P06) TaxID=701521 RepID=G8PC74_PEDCP|nr:isochorismatase family cysteine hydrolase [Pediococcus claussenii]AEV96052.1 isochorismatase family protein [Pediococcus claussenii ATCC BAA-344]ANZ69535.1 isochorismatase [Pediococcus claussenii]ANZ71354.1 isochorismatase [Pediococcus claussenii]KRN19424.1 hypothetical protein IV79_GL001476 [Pediococcus claussenii]